ncbi:casein kinase substrate phosphoprotein PP28-domain-containing protein [Mycena metata]|uniref:Casein kinase substrate phosphoprotein PP28-domain-containing protein n=1 Tax=Mycena metata TaxID=1033252 RepID=A0AAD7J414_9AGAR|nr:casein kinase substrate phosphoprotein PP28-domain-containing protein [Mycena metata]
MVRGSGKFKQKRGGGRNFSKNLVLDENGTAVSTDKRWAPRKNDEDGSDDEDEEEEEESEEESEEEPPAAGGSAEPQPELSRAERKELKKKQAAAKAAPEDDEDEDLINHNHVTKKMNISDIGTKELTRREREQKEKQEAKERYWKLHVAGKTDEAKADLGRLAKIRAEREAALAKRKAEAEAKAAEAEAKAAAQRR